MLNRRIARGAWLVLWTAVLVEGAHGQQPTLRDQIIAQERAELDALKAGDTAAFASLIADDAVFVDAAGQVAEPELVKHVAEFHLREYTMSEIQFVPLSPSSGLIVYRDAETGTSHVRTSLRTSSSRRSGHGKRVNGSVQSGDSGQIARGGKRPVILVSG